MLLHNIAIRRIVIAMKGTMKQYHILNVRKFMCQVVSLAADSAFLKYNAMSGYFQCLLSLNSLFKHQHILTLSTHAAHFSFFLIFSYFLSTTFAEISWHKGDICSSSNKKSMEPNHNYCRPDELCELQSHLMLQL